MIKNIYIDKEFAVCIGDIHGEFRFVGKRIKDSPIENCVMFICGDIGLGFNRLEKEQKELEAFNEILAEKNIIAIAVRGNHDDPFRFKEDLYGLSNFKVVSDYTVVSIGQEGPSVLCVGGGLSIDRVYRRTEFFERQLKAQSLGLPIDKIIPSYWENELPVYDEEALLNIERQGIGITHVVSHTSPSFAFKKDKNGLEYWMQLDGDLYYDLDMERGALDKVYEWLKSNGRKPYEWVHGHFHEHNDETIDETRFVALENADYRLDIYELKTRR